MSLQSRKDQVVVGIGLALILSASGVLGYALRSLWNLSAFEGSAAFVAVASILIATKVLIGGARENSTKEETDNQSGDEPSQDEKKLPVSMKYLILEYLAKVAVPAFTIIAALFGLIGWSLKVSAVNDAYLEATKEAQKEIQRIAGEARIAAIEAERSKISANNAYAEADQHSEKIKKLLAEIGSVEDLKQALANKQAIANALKGEPQFIADVAQVALQSLEYGSVDFYFDTPNAGGPPQNRLMVPNRNMDYDVELPNGKPTFGKKILAAWWTPHSFIKNVKMVHDIHLTVYEGNRLKLRTHFAPEQAQQGTFAFKVHVLFQE